MFHGSINFHHVSLLYALCVSIAYECNVVCFLPTASILVPPQTWKAPSPPQTVRATSCPQTVETISLPQTVGTTSPPQTVGTTSPPQTVGTTSPPQTVGTTSPPQTVGTTSPPQTVGTTSPPQIVGTISPPQTVGTTSLPQIVGTTFPPQTVGATSPPQIVGTTSPPQTVGTTSPPQTVETTSPPQTVGTTSLPQTVGTTSPPQTVGTTSPPRIVGTISPPQTVGTTSPPQTVGTTSPPRIVGTISSPQTVGTTSPPQTVGTTSPPQTVGTTSLPQTVGTTSPSTTVTVPVSSSTQSTKSYEATKTPSLICSNLQPTRSDGENISTAIVPVSCIQPTDNHPSDGATTTSVIIVVSVVIVLVVIVVGVVILVVLFRAKKRKQKLVISKLQSVTTENEDIEMIMKQERTTENETNSSAYQSPYAEIRTKAPPKVPTKSEELIEYLNLNSTVTGGYSQIELEPADTKYALPANPSRHVNISDPVQSSAVYQDIDQHPSTTSVQEADIYSVPDSSSSHTVEADGGISETVYSEPIQPSLFADAVGTADSEDLQPYGPTYTIPINLPKSKKVLLKVSGNNIREISEIGMGQFGKVILAETVGLSAKDLRLSESDDDKSKSTLVAVKKLKSDAPNATKEAFEKEVKFMSRLSDRNVIRILGVCYEDTPFIMMEYMAKGDLNQYLQKFRTLSATDSEPQGQITISTLVHIATQIASAMKYLVSHNYVHRDLATRNCLVGPNYLVKLSDFGMSRSLYSSHYYRIHGCFFLPVRWMAYECFYGKFSQKSDVWAFGVTMWEIFTLAKEQPYNYMSDEQVVENALKGKNRKTLPRPDMCPLKVYKIMLECWEHNSDQRATFEELFQLFTSVCQNV